MSERTHIPIIHVPKTKKPRKRIPRKSKRMSQQEKLYNLLREGFLRNHPFCQHFIAENKLDELDVIKNGGRTICWTDRFGAKGMWITAPAAMEIHHKKGRGKYLLDTRFFMAVRPGHAFYIHGNTKEAYEKGYMLPRN